MKIDLADRVRIAPNAMLQVVESESVILDLDSEQYFGLDEVGTRIWQLVVEHGGLREIRDRMIDEYDVAPQAAERDLLALVAELSEKGLVIVEPTADDGA